MDRRPRWLSPVSALMVATLVFAACAGTPATSSPAPTPTKAPATPAPATATPAPATATPVPATPAPTAYPTPAKTPAVPAANATSYPDYGDVDCKAGTFNNLPYAGNLKKISAPDPMTVVFEFCNPDVAFLAQIAFTALAVDDSQYLIDHMPKSVTQKGSEIPEGSLLTTPNGTGPYMLDKWERGQRITFKANPSYWGTAALTPGLEFRWSDKSAARLVELQSGTVDGIDNPGKDDIPAIQGDATLAFYPREGLNTFYLGFNNLDKPWDNLKIRQAIAMGIDRERIVTNFYPPGSSVADHFTPCAIAHGCAGTKDLPSFNVEAAKKLLDEGLTEEGMPTGGFATKLQYRNAVRGYLPDPPTIAQEIASQLKTNLNIDAQLDQQESGTYLDNNSAGKLDGIFMLGWGADYPDASNFLDFHFGPGTGKKFGTPIPALVDAIKKAGQTSDETQRDMLYGQANDLIVDNVPAVIIAHGGSGTAFKKDVEHAYAAPLQEEFDVVKAADRDTLRWMQNAEPISLYCGDETDGETLRACQQMKESLYGYKVGSVETEPRLATECTANADLTVWTCKLRPNVKFHDGSTFEASDVIVSFAAQWDALSPLHIGRTATFEYWPSLIGGGFLNPPAPCGLPNSAACPKS